MKTPHLAALTAACLATTPLLWLMTAWFSGRIQPEYARNRTLVELRLQGNPFDLGRHEAAVLAVRSTLCLGL